MDWLQLFFLHPLSFYQGAAFPFALLFNYLCILDTFSTRARYLFLLAGGGVLAFAAMGPYSLLIFIPALCAVALVSFLSPQEVHRLTFFFQMGWQTLCHLGLHYTEYYLGEPPPVRFYITLSSLMLLTQRVTSLSLDICEGKVEAPRRGIRSKSSFSEHLWDALPHFSYLLFFPALLGGSLCSFRRFQACVQRSSSLYPSISFRALTWRGLQILGLECLKVALRSAVSAGAGLDDCQRLECIYLMWSTAWLFKLTYYSHWILDDSLLHAAGFGAEAGQGPGEEGYVPDVDIWTLETTHRISLFARQWNRSTALWLRRLVFRKSRRWPLLQTFAFSAWWHGLHPGQVFGFLCWSVMVKADYLIHTFANVCIRSWPLRLLYRALTWAHTQLIIAYIMLAVEGRSLSSLCQLCCSYNSLFPVMYGLLLFLLAERKDKRN
ncbi:ghrelin O-acyltransferase isoform 1 [Mus musculus]|uniref:Membrane-bound ghrelin O-acyltransferase MBOAT4 n=2 Tax=Mus musculus TaxID=10090 RepID=MBOA4_MOUSE|nr:ghrelin O-acyltransferase isoform 1 [Mus musculus]P0C7A3.1 RecName: Full=Ghrelin O-acyltransferase; AltName: Full=Membrane-bound O-acyltransferase domain-containing protein 4; Short=O-acyltransferase domain-containing protein 4; Contains: RecName: Full=44,4 kDa fragment [Mus musculus]ACB05874.1 ghrelin O-acyltransferase [Mus musculus]ACD93144.1 ghrelin O-acyltransferase [Mus musculus]|eukprot:NP_001119786.1 ghrelin O-acyltransferase [Mus musculus]